jgi:hypothetical protein
MTEKQDYPYIWAWGRRLGSFRYFIEDQVEQARADNAPQNAIDRNQDGTWSTTDDITNPTTREALGLPPLEKYRVSVKIPMHHLDETTWWLIPISTSFRSRGIAEAWAACLSADYVIDREAVE